MINKLLTSDSLGYYQFLPGFFIDGKVDKLPWAIVLENGNHLSLFHIGVAILESPFFLLGHVISKLSGAEATGYGPIYAYSILFGTIVYVSIGIYYLQKFLGKRWEQKTVVISVLLLYFGTNIYYYTSFAGGYSHAYTFFLFCMFIFYTDKYHTKPSIQTAVVIGILSGLTLIIKPNNLVISLFFIFYGVKNLVDFRSKMNFFIQNYRHVLIILVMITICIIPQISYWHHVSDQWFLFSYGKNDQGFNWAHPELLNVLVHPQNGWFLYSPILLFAMYSLIKGIVLKRINHVLIFIIWALSWYVFASWWCWWFGAGFGHRAFVEYLPLFALPMCYFVAEYFKMEKFNRLRIGIGILMSLFVFISIRMTFLYHWPWDGEDWGWDDYFTIIQKVFFIA